MKGIIVLSTLLVVLGIGCETEYIVETEYVEVEVEVEVLPPLVPPQAVVAWAEDGQVEVGWLSSQDPTVVGYVIYRSTSEFDGYEEIIYIDGWDVTSYVDTGLQNGVTYYYAISTVDDIEEESELSPESMWATPRPEGQAKLVVDDTGFGFTIGDDWFCVREENNVLLLDVYEDVVIQDMGHTDSIYDITASSIRGFIPDAMRVIRGHTYVFRMTLPTGGVRYAKIRISDVGEEGITFDWAVQLQLNNPELAPKR